MTKLGELLKSEREKRGLSLHEIGMNLKISPKILKAIEDGDQHNLPAKTFLRGFVKSYAQFLRLDLDSTLQMFQQEYSGNRPASEEPTSSGTSSAPQTNASPSGPRFEHSLKRPDDSALPVVSSNRFYTIAMAIILLTLIAFVAKMMDKYQKESRISKSDLAAVEKAIESTTTTVPVEGPSTVTTTLPLPTTTPTSSPTAANSVNPTTLASPTTTVSSAPTTTLASPATTVSSTTTTTLASPTTTLKPAPVAATASTGTTSTPVAAPSVSTSTTLKPAIVEVIVEALNRVSIRFSLDGGVTSQTLTLNPDQVHTFRSRTSVQLEVSDGGAVNVIVNGRDRGVPGTIGKPIRLAYP